MGEDRIEFWRMLIDGEFVDGAAGETILVENPGKRIVFATVPRALREDVDRAVQAAGFAFPAWKRMPPRERGARLARIAADLVARNQDIARLLATETGNAIRTQSRPEVSIAAEIFSYFAGLGSELKGETIPVNASMLTYTTREPLGVVGAIIPWNAPLALAALKIAPALLAGNTLVLKASEEAPLAVLELGRICSEHLPKGVLNILTGYGHECGVALTEHPQISKLTFTGSTDTGKKIMRVAADRVVPVSLELGGKSPNIVFPDGDEEWVVDGAISASRFHRQSQSCTTGSRLFVHRKIFDSFISKLVEKCGQLKVGDPLDESSDIGAVINERQFSKICGFIEDGLEQPAAKLIAGGLPSKEGPLSSGYFTKPTIFTGVGNDWRMAREEIFGPVLVAIPWSDEDEVIRLANDTHYGLAAYIWTHDIGRALRTAERIDAGFLQINQGLGQFPGQSYGGIKQSGMGREHSLEGMLESFTTRKTFVINVATPSPGL